MFHVSRRLTYGIQLMVALASSKDQQPQPTALLAKQLHIPLPFLHQIGHTLMQAGLIKATPGPHGGLKLNQALHEINLLMILEALEGPVRLSKSTSMKTRQGQIAEDPTRYVWQDLEQNIIDHLASQRLDALANQAK
jgi:Rrf2 family protein